MPEFLLARLRKKLKKREPIVSITAYDYFTALVAREADVDFVLVGDSLGNVVQGGATTVRVTLDDVIYHTRIVCQHFPAERVVLDMPFGTFKLDADETVKNCARAFKEAGCGAVKFEGAGNENLFATRTLSEAGVPVMGHLGLLPQRVHSEGGFRLQGRTDTQAAELVREALALEEAGSFSVVLECVLPEVASSITEKLQIPTIGIGSGTDCDGQIIVMHDILGMLPDAPPSFVTRYAELYEVAVNATREYAADVRNGAFPSVEPPVAETASRGADVRRGSPQPK